MTDKITRKVVKALDGGSYLDKLIEEVEAELKKRGLKNMVMDGMEVRYVVEKEKGIRKVQITIGGTDLDE